ncbi:thioesterase family protein [Chitinophaga sp. ARDCPP14]|uniref:thioesterase family protein n=1 Tax=Chitinophaga sp. ARDCPP14 TaxID=3391139 RepID=UPI003F51E76C
MLPLFKPGDTKHFSRTVRQEDCASFDSGQVHPVYATFALARDAEWCCRLFVMEMKEAQEEGIGTRLTVEHLSPALAGSQVDFTAVITGIQHHEITCSYEAVCNGRVIATGIQVQKILPKAKLDRLFAGL